MTFHGFSIYMMKLFILYWLLFIPNSIVNFNNLRSMAGGRVYYI